MLSSALFRDGDIVTPCSPSTYRLHMLYDPLIFCRYDEYVRGQYFNEPAHIYVRHVGTTVTYYNIDTDAREYSWTDEAFAEAQPIFRYLNWDENGNELR